jgi:hypothetical protein
MCIPQFIILAKGKLTIASLLGVITEPSSPPLLLHNWKDIYALWLEAFDLESADDKGFRLLLECVNLKRFHFVTYSDLQIFVCSLLQKMAHDLRTTISPIYPDLLKNYLCFHASKWYSLL